jgi:quinol monooxygenase YgiN
MSNVDQSVWPCVLGGIALGATAALGAMHLMRPQQDKCHVLLVELSFKSVADREKWAAAWSHLAERVYANEPHCLSYKLSVSCEDPLKALIYERYSHRDYLDGVHQESIKAHNALAISKSGVEVSAKLIHFTETTIGHMTR